MDTSKPHTNGSGDSDAGSARISSAATKPEGTAWSWVLALFGTAMDAGILFPPLQAGSFGKISVLTQVWRDARKRLSRFCSSGVARKTGPRLTLDC